MIWQTINPNNLPKKEVLAINLTNYDFPEDRPIDYGEKAVGYLDYDLNRIWCRDNFGEILMIGCTHYIEIDSIQMPNCDSSTDHLSEIVDALCGRSTFPVPPGKILAAAIEEIGVSPSKFAEMLGVHPKTVGEFTLGDRTISAEMGELIGSVLEMDDRQWFELQKKIVAARCEN
jgi:plasmid maintenance system antidote protein VapI